LNWGKESGAPHYTTSSIHLLLILGSKYSPHNVRDHISHPYLTEMGKIIVLYILMVIFLDWCIT
jgi:hypothetical protein